MIDIKELRRLAQAATPGPWKMLPVGDGRQKFAVANSEFLSILTVTDEGGATFGTVYDDADARLIAAANPATVIELLGRLEAAESDALEQARLNGMGASREAALMEKLEAAEKDIALKERIIDALGSALNAVANERDALRAKVEAMGRQELVYLFRRKGWEEFCTCSKERYEEFYTNPRVFEVKKLYALPGAKGEGE